MLLLSRRRNATHTSSLVKKSVWSHRIIQKIRVFLLYCYAEYDDSSYLANRIWELYPRFIQRGLYIGNSLYTVSPNSIQANNYGGSYELQKKIDTAQ
jgi:hypothetical protein